MTVYSVLLRSKVGCPYWLHSHSVSLLLLPASLPCICIRKLTSCPGRIRTCQSVFAWVRAQIGVPRLPLIKQLSRARTAAPLFSFLTMSVDSATVPLTSPQVQLAQGIFFAIVILGGLVLLPVVLLILALSKGPPPTSSMVNFLVGLSISSIGQTLLPFSGHLSDLAPPKGLCITQMGLIYSGLTMSGIAAIMSVVRLSLTLPGKTAGSRGQLPMIIQVVMATLPPAAGIAFFLVQTGVAMGSPEPHLLGRSQLVCIFDTGAPLILRKGHYFVLAIPLGVVFMMIAYLTFRVRAFLRPLGNLQWRRALKSEEGTWFAILARIMIFEVLSGCAAITIRVLDTIPSSGMVFHVLAEAVGGLLPIFAFLVFGTTERVRTVLFGWCFERRPAPSLEDGARTK
ncbi:hypothetical protein EXIGLDRAFT_127144 [Exidia glandulosa HHB12029]|uniref:Uncharacterized protein n=1 Tax=Exidia glandulosa HHB12029 TaxID=1314781 RepID=A0A165GA09_EXIGL|nr:hypothetical protein EXIGLDRAFT_127144 [Exidia glandulosa HHB12029]